MLQSNHRKKAAIAIVMKIMIYNKLVCKIVPKPIYLKTVSWNKVQQKLVAKETTARIKNTATNFP